VVHECEEFIAFCLPDAMNLAPASSSGGFMGIGRNIDHERLDDLRRGRGPVQEHVIDEFVAGRLSRRDFIRKGSAIGLSMPLIGGIHAAANVCAARYHLPALRKLRSA
jgi:hypothetical protein